MKSQKSKEKINLYRYEEELYDEGFKNVCGIDEAGRGPLAGPVVVAACIMPPFLRIDGINDSKQLSEKKREELYKIIVKNAIAYSVIFVNEQTIDEMNILNATKKGMLEAVETLKVTPDYVLIDAVKLDELKMDSKAIVHGDALSASIAAASILAKVSRDHYMEAMDKKYPNYGFARHKGYGTKAHFEALEKYGPCKIHRKTFWPVSKYFSKQVSLFDLEEEEQKEENK